jgi:hypothetical protein
MTWRALCISPWRLAGKSGKTKFTIENSTRTRIVIADQHIRILGSFQAGPHRALIRDQKGDLNCSDDNHQTLSVLPRLPRIAREGAVITEHLRLSSRRKEPHHATTLPHPNNVNVERTV